MIAYNAAAQLVGLFSTALLQAFFGIIAARFLGVEDFGRFAFVWAITQILVASGDLGLHNTAIRRISSEPGRSLGLFSGFYSLKLLLSAVLLSVMLLLSLLIGDSGEMRLALLLFGLGTVSHSTNLSLNIAFQAHGKLYLGSLNGVVISALQFVFGIGLLLSGGKLISLGLAYALATSLALVVNYRTFERWVHRVELGGYFLLERNDPGIPSGWPWEPLLYHFFQGPDHTPSVSCWQFPDRALLRSFSRELGLGQHPGSDTQCGSTRDGFASRRSEAGTFAAGEVVSVDGRLISDPDAVVAPFFNRTGRLPFRTGLLLV